MENENNILQDEEVQHVKELAESGLVGAYKKTYFVMADNAFIRNPKYTPVQKMVYLCLQSYAGAVSSCFPSKETLAKDLGVATRTVYTALKELEKHGGVIIANQITETNRKTSNLYILAEIDKDTGEFIPESIEKFKVLTLEPLRVKEKLKW